MRLLIGIFLIAIAGLARAEDNSPAVLTYAEHQGGNVIYHYQINSNGAAGVRRLFIGCDCRTNGIGLPQLQTAPVNASRVRTDDLATWYELPPEAAQQPPGWRVRMAQPHGTTGYWIEWYRPGVRAEAGAPGSALGFAVVVPGADEAYLTGDYTVQPQGSARSGTLTLLDTTPPTLTLKARTVRGTDDGTPTIQVAAIAKDDLDPEPLVVAESVRISPSPAEPGYTVVYSATDASGNRTTASARVPLPLPERTGPRGTPPARRNLPRLALLP